MPAQPRPTPPAGGLTPAADAPADHLFVYGSLRAGVARDLPEEAARARALLGAAARRIGRGSVQGRLYDVAWYPGLVSGRRPSERVVGDVWRILDREALLPALDAYEAARSRRRPRAPRGHEYVRDRRRVRLEDGGAVSAWVYLFDGPVEGLPRIASGDYVAWSREPAAAGRAR
jgi:gamma-glutamylcyclotransferase (GGCT)/AIG2-like uncharacterized protein YtfP